MGKYLSAFLLFACLAHFPAPAAATPTRAQMDAIFADLQTPVRYGAILPSPATWQGNVLVPSGVYSAPQVYSFDGVWYLLAALTQAGGSASSILFSATSPLGPWTMLGTAMSGSSWDNCLAVGTVGLAGSVWGEVTPQMFNNLYYMAYYGSSNCNLSGTSEGISWAPLPSQAVAWSRGPSPVLSPKRCHGYRVRPKCSVPRSRGDAPDSRRD